jgi:hypothetical protein
VIGVQKTQDGVVRFFSIVIFIDGGENAGGIVLLKTTGELNNAVNRSVAADVTTDEPDHDNRRFLLDCPGIARSACAPVAGSREKQEQDGPNANQC